MLGAKQDYEKAIADYDESIRLGPSKGLAYLNRGLAWFHKDECDKAIADYTEAIRLDPIDVQRGSLRTSAYNLRGRERQEKGETDAAIADFNEAIRLDPERRHRLPQPRARVERQGRTTTRPSPTTPRPSGSTPSAAYVYSIAAMRGSMKQKYDKAIADYTEAIRLDPEDPVAYYHRGCV